MLLEIFDSYQRPNGVDLSVYSICLPNTPSVKVILTRLEQANSHVSLAEL
jgi:hypothetical protein